MPLASGTKLGPYEILAPLGAGGMGEVYRARDAKLSRDVALKIISPEFAHDEQRMARFQREAQLLASLNHTHIASIYGFEESGNIRALVMELVEGPTLAERIKQGPIPLEEALPIAKQIAEALESAHERGIIHRDLKPANIKLTHDGKVKVLDFGLAKAMMDGSSSQDISNSPTLTMASTKEGVILGTAAYMSPEQAKGKVVDRRSDIWSFGAVLFEMLSGQQTFGGETVSDALAAIIKDTPDWSALPSSTPKRVRDLLQRCLQKDPRQRLQAIGDARIAIDEILSGSAQDDDDDRVVLGASQLPAAQAWRRFVPWALTAALVVALLVALFALRQASQLPALKPVELSLWIPADQQLDTFDGPAVAISPDGSRIAYAIRNRGSNLGKLYVREMDNKAAVLLDGAAEDSVPFFSPDSQWIGVFGDGKLKKVSVRGGASIVVADVAAYRGGTWSEDGTIVFPMQFTSPLYRVPAAGGTPEAFTHLDSSRSETTHRWPQFLPGGKAVLFTASADNNFFEHASVQAASLDKGVAKVLVENAFFGRYLAGGYLAYVSQGTVFVAPFDAKELKITGTAVPVLQGVDTDLSSGAAQISISRNGTAVYLSGGTLNKNVNVALLDRKGNASPLVDDRPDAASPSISPDGKRIAFQSTNGIWVRDISRGTTSPLAPGTSGATYPVWSPDGEWLTYSHARTTSKGSGQAIYRKRSDGTGEEETLTPEDFLNAYPSSWSPDGKTLAFYQLSDKDGCCVIWTLTLDEKGKPGEPRRFLDQASNGKVRAPQFSPDGRWLSYNSRESGVPQIYVVPFSGSGGKWQISTDGGRESRWSKTGHELFYVALTGNSLVAVPYSVDKNSFQPGKPEILFSDSFEMRVPFTSYDVMPDGQHFVMFQFAGGRTTPGSLPTVVLNWLDEVRRQVSAGQSDAAK
ncbi:MAG TPA: protein kinase [Candidatus Acidoferrales bacterium]|nr:protein kinase [Candidatus Acidoferrales bacterium]